MEGGRKQDLVFCLFIRPRPAYIIMHRHPANGRGRAIGKGRLRTVAVAITTTTGAHPFFSKQWYTVPWYTISYICEQRRKASRPCLFINIYITKTISSVLPFALSVWDGDFSLTCLAIRRGFVRCKFTSVVGSGFLGTRLQLPWMSQMTRRACAPWCGGRHGPTELPTCPTTAKLLHRAHQS